MFTRLRLDTTDCSTLTNHASNFRDKLKID